jgi:hypothetical protein
MIIRIHPLHFANFSLEVDAETERFVPIGMHRHLYNRFFNRLFNSLFSRRRRLAHVHFIHLGSVAMGPNAYTLI